MMTPERLSNMLGSIVGTFLIVQRVRQGCAANSFLFDISCHSALRWIDEGVFPRRAVQARFLQPSLCA